MANLFFFFQAEDGIRDIGVTGVQTCALPILTAGPPFFALSASAPLLQRWFSRTRDPSAGDPYFLYAASNAGSLLALLAFPALFEPTLTLGGQSRAWALGYCALVVLVVACRSEERRVGKE